MSDASTKKHDIVRLAPVQPPRTLLPQCDVATIWSAHHLIEGGFRYKQGEKYKKYGWDIDKCKHFATYRINGRNLCKIHAGPVALKILCEM